jgi:hypothetical protein
MFTSILQSPVPAKAAMESALVSGWVSVGRLESLILKRFGIFDGESDGVDPHYVVGGLGSVVDDILM